MQILYSLFFSFGSKTKFGILFGGVIYLHESSSWVEIRMNTENQLSLYPGSGKGGGGDRPITLSPQLRVGLSWAVTIFI